MSIQTLWKTRKNRQRASRLYNLDDDVERNPTVTPKELAFNVSGNIKKEDNQIFRKKFVDRQIPLLTSFQNKEYENIMRI